MARVYLGLGSNQGDRAANIARALKMLTEIKDIRLMALSSLYETKPVDFVDQPDFINCVAKISTKLNPHALLISLKSIEKNMGRAPDSHLMPRPIDIDILLYDDLTLDSPDLTIPHARLKYRRFALEPLLEIAPELIDPVLSSPLDAYLILVADQALIKIPDAKEVANVRRSIK